MKLLISLCFYLAVTAAAYAGPGAHGPNGEHLDAPGGAVSADASPRIETFTESFELVGRLQGGELSILIDRFETNEPVLNATLEVELNGMKAPAKFHADHGDYSVDDPKMLAELAKPGEHALVFTLAAGQDSDLLEGTLAVKAAAAGAEHSHDHDDHEHGHVMGLSLTAWAILGIITAVIFSAIALRMARRQPAVRK